MPLDNDQKTEESGNDNPPEKNLVTEESGNDNSPTTKLVKARQLLSRVTKVSSGISSGIVAKVSKTDLSFCRKPWFWAGLGLGAAVTGGVVAYNNEIEKIDSSLPARSKLSAIAREQTLTVKASDGTILQQKGEVTREYLKIKKIPDLLKKAFIASEDRRFKEHNGVDTQGVFRAFVNNVRSQDVVEGGSTITQQVARILFLNQEKTVWRKVKEMRLAQKIEEELTKDEILERYLNLVYLGSGAYGVGDAAWIYFSKSVDELTLSEMATIAGLAPAPNSYAPDKNLAAALERRNLVLNIMQEEGMITAKEQQDAMAEKLVVKSNKHKRTEVRFPYFTTYAIQQELPKYLSKDVLAEGGLVVETTLNPKLQSAAEKAVTKTLRNKGRWQNFKQAALVAIDPHSGEIQALVGGKDFGKNQFNRATQAQRQPGSTFKGFVYAAAVASGKSPNKRYLDAPLIVDGYEPKNYSESFAGWMSMGNALTRSINTIAVKVLMDVGYNPTIKMAKEMGIKSPLKPTYSLALGSNEVNLLELTSAYGSFATQGLHTEVHGIRRIFNRQGNVIWSANFESERVLDKTSAAIMTWMLRNVVNRGTAGTARLYDRQIAGKTGTSDKSRDLWFIGYIPQMVTGVWLGNDDNRPTWGNSASAAYAWREFMKVAVKGMPVEWFPARPRLDKRKASIKAEPIKPGRIITRSVASRSDSSNSSSTRRRRRRRTTTTVRRRRRRRTSQVNRRTNTNTRTRRRVRRSSRQQPTTTRRRTRRRVRRRSTTPARRPAPVRRTRRTAPKPSAPKPSWRERLKPGSSN